MASRRAKVLLASVACCAPLLLAGLRIAADAPDNTASSPSVRQNPPIALAAGDDAATAQQPPQQPQSRPQSQPVATAPANPVRLPGWPFERPGRPVAGTPAPNDEEWRQTVALFSEISPARWQVFEQVLAKPGRRERGRRYLFARYNELREFQKTNPGAYQAKIQQVKFEDEVFRLDAAIRAAASQADAEKLRAQLRDTVMERVKKDQNDRDQRLKQLQDRIDREKAALEQDRARAEQITDNRANNLRRLSNVYRNWAAGKNPDGSTPVSRQNRSTPSAPAAGNDKPASDSDD